MNRRQFLTGISAAAAGPGALRGAAGAECGCAMMPALQAATASGWGAPRIKITNVNETPPSETPAEAEPAKIKILNVHEAPNLERVKTRITGMIAAPPAPTLEIINSAPIRARITTITLPPTTGQTPKHSWLLSVAGNTLVPK